MIKGYRILDWCLICGGLWLIIVGPSGGSSWWSKRVEVGCQQTMCFSPGVRHSLLVGVCCLSVVWPRAAKDLAVAGASTAVLGRCSLTGISIDCYIELIKDILNPHECNPLVWQFEVLINASLLSPNPWLNALRVRMHPIQLFGIPLELSVGYQHVFAGGGRDGDCLEGRLAVATSMGWLAVLSMCMLVLAVAKAIRSSSTSLLLGQRRSVQDVWLMHWQHGALQTCGSVSAGKFGALWVQR